ncbi:Alcohol acetyltransferase [Extremus antarcticus]|uniref:Alcohol acetyltransferase n=1 Tax=Extremus antarcticus TaxID=702011 RepID=A0AAJ0DI15_9PEZI|nr:Alcohol acetyltransferase [Extremus antarcticus]
MILHRVAKGDKANTSRYAIRLPGTDLEATFRQSLRDLIQATPALQVSIRGEDSKTSVFVRGGEMKVSDHLRWTKVGPGDETEPLLRTLEEQHGRAWPDVHRRPPWTVICTEFAPQSGPEDTDTTAEVEVTFAVHHAVADGLSTVVFHQQLLEALNRRLGDDNTGNADHLIMIEDEVILDPPVDKVISFELSWSFFLSTLWNEFGPRLPFSAALVPPWTGSVVATERNTVNIRLIELPSSAAAELLMRCKAEKATPTSLLHGIIAYSFSRQLPAEAAESFVAQTSISLRPYMRSDANAQNLIGGYCTSQSHPIAPSTVLALRSASSPIAQMPAEIEIIKLARTIKADLRQRLASLPKDDGNGLLPYVSDWRERWNKMLGQRRNVTWEVSNLGAIACKPTQGEVRCEINRVLLTQSANVGGPAMSVNVAGVKGGALAVTVCWQEGVIEVAVMEGLAEDLELWLGRLGS